MTVVPLWDTATIPKEFRSAETIYMADGEQCPNEFLEAFALHASAATAMAFFHPATAMPKSIIYLRQSEKEKHNICFVTCKKGDQGVDKMLLVYIPLLATLNPKAKYVILAGDNGYDDCINVLKKCQINVTRMSPKADIRKLAAQKALSQAQQKQHAIAVYVADLFKDKQISIDPDKMAEVLLKTDKTCSNLPKLLNNEFGQDVSLQFFKKTSKNERKKLRAVRDNA